MENVAIKNIFINNDNKIRDFISAKFSISVQAVNEKMTENCAQIDSI